MAGSARSWRVALAVAMNEIEPTPISTRAARATASLGAAATATIMIPKKIPILLSSAVDGRLRWATSSPPITAPQPMAAVSAL